ncbi:MAG: TldD/PmbA family protein [Bacteroidales bacterium]|nr:TldD/PmbA family protein [Candidatus Cryptobacteroides fimicaballi]
MILNKEYYLGVFGIGETNLEELVAQALKNGGDYADLYFEDTFYSDILLRDSAVSAGGQHLDYGCGIRVLCGEKTGYAYSESTDIPSLTRAAAAAGVIADEAVCSEVAVSPANRYFGKPNPKADRYPFTGDWRNEPLSTAVPFLESIESAIRAKENRCCKVIASLSTSVSDILMYNSYGELKYETRPLASLSITTIFQQEGKTVQNSVGRSLRTGTEFLTPQLATELAQEAVKGVDALFDAKRPKGGKMSVVMGAGASGILLHEAMGHAFEADFNRKGQSVFADRMGKSICPKGINIIDDGTIPANRGACNFDDEGVPGQKTYMVEDGILASYLHDRVSARWYGVAPTGNGRRESFRYNPIPRMRATYMESGKDGSVQDLIAEAGNGIYVDSFSNGEVKIGEGDFTFYVKSGYLIENGRLTMPVKDINIVGNGPRALADIKGVAADLKIDDGTWTCGKEQSVAVSCGIPSVLIGKLTVGGE